MKRNFVFVPIFVIVLVYAFFLYPIIPESIRVDPSGWWAFLINRVFGFLKVPFFNLFGNEVHFTYDSMGNISVSLLHYIITTAWIAVVALVEAGVLAFLQKGRRLYKHIIAVGGLLLVTYFVIPYLAFVTWYGGMGNWGIAATRGIFSFLYFLLVLATFSLLFSLLLKVWRNKESTAVKND